MTCDDVSIGTSDQRLLDTLLTAAARLDAVGSARAALASDASVAWQGATRDRFDDERTRQSARAVHLHLQARRLAAELSGR